MIASRRRLRTTSRKSSSRLLAASDCWFDSPVTLPPGRARPYDQAAADRIDRNRKDDGDGRCRLFYRGDSGSIRDNDINIQADKLGCDLGVALGSSLRPAILDRDGAALDPAEFTQSPHKGVSPRTPG